MVVDASYSEKSTSGDSSERHESGRSASLKLRINLDNNQEADMNSNVLKSKLVTMNGSDSKYNVNGLIKVESICKTNGLVTTDAKCIPNGVAYKPVNGVVKSLDDSSTYIHNNNNQRIESNTPSKVSVPPIRSQSIERDHCVTNGDRYNIEPPTTRQGLLSVANNSKNEINNNVVGSNVSPTSPSSFFNVNPNLVNNNLSVVYNNNAYSSPMNGIGVVMRNNVLSTANNTFNVGNQGMAIVNSNTNVIRGTVQRQPSDITMHTQIKENPPMVAITPSNIKTPIMNPPTINQHNVNVATINPYAFKPNPIASHRNNQIISPNRDFLFPVLSEPKLPLSNEAMTKVLQHLPPALPPPQLYTDLGNGVFMPPTLTTGLPVPGFVYGVPSSTTCYVQPSLPQMLPQLNYESCQILTMNGNYVPTYGGAGSATVSPTLVRDITNSSQGNKDMMAVAPSSLVTFPTTAPSTITMHSSLSPTASMELVWHGEFDRLFSQYLPHIWYLMPTFYPPNESWMIFKDSAKVRFSCQCGHGWTSMKGRVIFWFYINYSTNAGYVLFKLYGQQCVKCKSGNYEHAMWYPEEVVKVIGNVYNRVGQLYYGFVRPPLRIDRRQGKPRNQHNSALCQACTDGLCKEEWSFS